MIASVRDKIHQQRYRPSGVKEYQGNQGYSGGQTNVIQGQRPDMENRHAQQRT